MSGIGDDLTTLLRGAGRAMEDLGARMKAYQGDISRGAWDEAEEKRAEAHAGLDDFFDAFGIAHKIIERARRAAR